MLARLLVVASTYPLVIATGDRVLKTGEMSRMEHCIGQGKTTTS